MRKNHRSIHIGFSASCDDILVSYLPVLLNLSTCRHTNTLYVGKLSSNYQYE